MVFCDIDDLNPYQAGQDIIAVQSRGGGWKLDASATRALYGEATARDQAHVNKTMPVPVAPQPAPRPQVQPQPVAGDRRPGGNAEAFEAIVNGEMALMADLVGRAERNLSKSSDDARQKYVTTMFISLRKTQSDDDLIAWAAQRAKNEMGW